MNYLHSRFSSFINRLRYGEPRPARDWLSLITLAVLALAAIIVWNLWAFDTVVNGGTIGTSATSTPPLFNQSSLDAIHAVFSDRAAEEQNYVTGVYRFADPSQ